MIADETEFKPRKPIQRPKTSSYSLDRAKSHSHQRDVSSTSSFINNEKSIPTKLGKQSMFSVHGSFKRRSITSAHSSRKRSMLYGSNKSMDTIIPFSKSSTFRQQRRISKWLDRQQIPVVPNTPKPKKKPKVIRSGRSLSKATSFANHSASNAMSKINRCTSEEIVVPRVSEIEKSLSKDFGKVQQYLKLIDNRNQNSRIEILQECCSKYRKLYKGKSCFYRFKLDSDNPVCGLRITVNALHGEVLGYASQSEMYPKPEEHSWKTDKFGEINVHEGDPNFQADDVFIRITARADASIKVVGKWNYVHRSSRIRTTATERIEKKLAAKRKRWKQKYRTCNGRRSQTLEKESVSPLRGGNMTPQQFLETKNFKLNVKQKKLHQSVLFVPKTKLSSFDVWKLHQEVKLIQEIGGIKLEEPIKLYQTVHRSMMPEAMEKLRRLITFEQLEMAGMTDEQLKKEKIVLTGGAKQHHSYI